MRQDLGLLVAQPGAFLLDFRKRVARRLLIAEAVLDHGQAGQAGIAGGLRQVLGARLVVAAEHEQGVADRRMGARHLRVHLQRLPGRRDRGLIIACRVLDSACRAMNQWIQLVEQQCPLDGRGGVLTAADARTVLRIPREHGGFACAEFPRSLERLTGAAGIEFALEELVTQLIGYLRGMWRFRWWGLALAWVVGIVGSMAVYLMPDHYESSARIHVDTQSVLRPLMSGLAVQPNIGQQIDLLSRTLISRPNVEKLITMADLDLTVQNAEQREALITSVTKRLSIQSGRGDNLFTLSYNDPEPGRSCHRAARSRCHQFSAARRTPAGRSLLR